MRLSNIESQFRLSQCSRGCERVSMINDPVPPLLELWRREGHTPSTASNTCWRQHSAGLPSSACPGSLRGWRAALLPDPLLGHHGVRGFRRVGGRAPQPLLRRVARDAGAGEEGRVHRDASGREKRLGPGSCASDVFMGPGRGQSMKFSGHIKIIKPQQLLGKN